MDQEMPPGGETGHEIEPHAAEPSRTLPVPAGNVLPVAGRERSGRAELRQIGQLLEQAAGLTLDVLDLTGDMIAERLGLRRTEVDRSSDAG